MREIMETMVHPAAWRCGYYLSSGVDSTKRQIYLIFLENKSNIPVDNGSSLNTPIIKLTSQFVNITIIMDTVLVL
jgi:hypothetical protein